MKQLDHYPRGVVRRLRSCRRLVGEYRYFRSIKRQHVALVQPDATRAPEPGLAASIVEDGFGVVRGFLPEDVVGRIAEDVKPTLEAVAENRYSGPLKTRRLEEAGLFRLHDVENELSPASRAFYDSAFIAGMANSMTATGMHSKDRYADYKSKVGAREPNVDYHVDHWKTRFKVFLLLQDVTEDQAPFVYVVGSHKEAPWRRQWDWGYQHRETQGAILSPEQVATIRRKYGYDERVVTGRAGDLILAHTRGIHRGTILYSGTRLQLVNLFVMNGPPDYAC